MYANVAQSGTILDPGTILSLPDAGITKYCLATGITRRLGTVALLCADLLSQAIVDGIPHWYGQRHSALGAVLQQCMVRRVTARASLVEKRSLRQCIRPLVESCAPGQDEFRCVSVLTSRTVLEDHYRKQVSETPF